MDLDLIEQDIELIFEQCHHLSIEQIQIKLEQSLNHCRTLSLPNCQIRYFLDKIDQLNGHLNTYLTSSVNLTNGSHSPQVSELTNEISRISRD